MSFDLHAPLLAYKLRANLLYYFVQCWENHIITAIRANCLSKVVETFLFVYMHAQQKREEYMHACI